MLTTTTKVSGCSTQHRRSCRYLKGNLAKLPNKPVRVATRRKVAGLHRKAKRFRFGLKTVATCQPLEETALTECFRCKRVATYQNYCYLHWQERVSSGYFMPEAAAALTAYNLALA